MQPLQDTLRKIDQTARDRRMPAGADGAGKVHRELRH